MPCDGICCCCTDSDRRALQPVIQCCWKLSLDGVKAALKAGADANGPPEDPIPYIVVATFADDDGLVNILLEQGADPNSPITVEVPFPSSDDYWKTSIPGERALHIAARSGKVEIVRVLLKWSRTDPNATDSKGCTPLVRTCNYEHVCVKIVLLLLEAGADPALAEKDGYFPLYVVAQKGHMDLIDMLYTAAPATLNRYPPNGMTPLSVACCEGNESMVSKLLSLGAMQPMPPIGRDWWCPLKVAVQEGRVDVVRVLINEGGIRAVGGAGPLLKALNAAVCYRQARILQLLLTMDGEETRSEWANTIDSCAGSHLLHYSAGLCYPAAVSILLEVGANEKALNSQGLTPRDAIGVEIGQGEPQMDPEKGVTIRRMLQQGPAYRALSWAWPSDTEEADAGSSGGGDTTAAAAAVLSSPSAVKTPPVIGVQIFRPKEKGRCKFFVRLVGR